MANPFPYVSGAVLTAAQLNGIGEQTSFTPTISGITLGNGTKTGVYVRINKLVWFKVRLVFGSTSAIIGSVDVTLPIAPAAYATFYAMNVTAQYFDTSATTFYPGASVNIAGSTIRMGAIAAAGTYANYTDVTSLVPMFWATGDTLEVFGTYEVA